MPEDVLVQTHADAVQTLEPSSGEDVLVQLDLLPSALHRTYLERLPILPEHFGLERVFVPVVQSQLVF